MECQTTDSKKVFKVFEASKRKKCRRKKESLDDTRSLGTEESKSLLQTSTTIKSAKASLQDLTGGGEDRKQWKQGSERESSPSATPSPTRTVHHVHRTSPRRHHRLHRDDISLALHAGLVSTPRSTSPQPGRKADYDGDGLPENIPIDQDSFVYAFLEEAIKKDKRHRRRRDTHRRNRDREHSYDKNQSRNVDDERSRDHEDRERERERDRERDRARDKEDRSRHHDREKDPNRTLEYDRSHDRRDNDRSRDRRDGEDTSRQRHHRRRRHEDSSRYDEKPVKEKCPMPVVDQNVLFETFAKLCTTITEKNATPTHQARAAQVAVELVRNQSHKSLQCEVQSKNESCDVDHQPVRLHSREVMPGVVKRSYTRVKSLEDIHASPRVRSPRRSPEREKYHTHYEKLPHKYMSKMDVVPSRTRQQDDDRYRDYPSAFPTRSCMDRSEYDERRDSVIERRIFEEERRRLEEKRRKAYEEDRRKTYEEDRRKAYEEDRRRCEQKMSRSFDIHRDPYEEERLRRTTRSDSRRKRYEETRSRCDMRESPYNERREKFYEEREREYRERQMGFNKDRWRRPTERCERASVASREEEPARERDGRDGCSERERDSEMSAADGDSAASGKTSYLRVVKQGIAEQREAMDKMMKLWKELMRCFKSISQSPTPDKAMQDSAASVQESATAQLRLWRECMRRYETVARDVGDTDARLMEELSKQRSEMAEMASMWQECLQRYRDMSNDFKNLKQQLASESTSQAQGTARPPVPLPHCAEGETPATQPALSPYRMPPVYPQPMPAMPYGGGGGSPLRQRASMPPAWWWMNEPAPAPVRRRSSPDSRRSGSRDRRDRDHHHRHSHKDRDREDSRYKDKPSAKQSAARSDQRRRKR